MPKLDPSQIHEVLKQTGIRKSSSPRGKEEIKDLLENNSLGAEDVLDTLGSLMRGAENETTRLRAAEMGLKLNGLLQNDQVAAPSLTIVIRDKASAEVNPILIPR